MTFNEKKTLADQVRASSIELREKIDILYHDKYNSSIMMSPENTTTSNQIKRKFKWEMTKRTSL